jgi:serine O-acetyltransferase
VWGATQQGLPRVLVAVLHRLLNTFVVRNVYGIEISKSTVIGRRLLIAHHQGVILGYDAIIGDDCLVRQNVTVGAATDEGGQPRIGSGVHFGAGATVVGAVRVGDGARIAPGAVVTRHVPAGAIAFGPPVRLLATTQPDDEPVP